MGNTFSFAQFFGIRGKVEIFGKKKNSRTEIILRVLDYPDSIPDFVDISGETISPLRWPQDANDDL